MEPPSASITASMRIQNWEHAFSTSAGGSSANARRIIGDQAGFGVVGRSCWWCSRRMTKRSSTAGSGWEKRGGAVREGYKVWSQAWVSLDLWGGAKSCCYTQGLTPATWLHQGITTLQHIQVNFDVDFQADFEDMRWHDVALTWNHTKDHNCSRKICFHPPGHVPVFRDNPDLHFEGAGNGPVVITWIGREHELYSGASPISLVEHCVTFRHDRRLLSLLVFVHNWPTSRWSATKKRKPVFIKR